MKEFAIRSEVFLGCHCSGSGEYAEGEGSVELGEGQVQQLVDLIRENGGSTDVDVLGLEERLPEVYAVLDAAYRGLAIQAVRDHWIAEGFENGWIEQPDDLMERLIGDGLFVSGLDEDGLREELGLSEDDELSEEDIEDARRDEFETWLSSYTLRMSREELVDFVRDYYGDDVVEIDYGDVEYTVAIPEGIAGLAGS